MGERVPVEERARRYVDTMPAAVSGAGGHNATLHVACVLVQGFDLPMAEARSILQDYNRRCDPPWSEAELEHKLRSAAGMPGLKTTAGVLARGCLLNTPSDPQRPRNDYVAPAPVPKPEYHPERLKKLAAPWSGVVDLRWLANRSFEDPSLVDSDRFLRIMYPGEKILVFTEQKSQGQALWPEQALPSGGPDGVWFLAQPVDGKEYPNPRTMKPSRRSAESVTSFRYLLLESDEAPMREWLGLLVQVPLRIEAIYTSGKRSIHALVRINASTKKAWDEEKDALGPTLNLFGIAGVDMKALSAVRLTRLPGAMRGNKPQKLLYLQPNAPLRPLCEMPARRDIEALWSSASLAPISESDDTTWLTVKRALTYYANVSPVLKQAGVEFDKRISTP